VLCLTCGTKNVEGALFCRACGSSLAATRTEARTRPCGRCGTLNDPAARYCRDCGHELGVPGPLRSRITLRRLMIVGGILGLLFLIPLVGAPIIVLLLAILPAVVYVTLAVWIDRYEPEPWWMAAGAFLWGGSVALILSGIVNVTGRDLVSADLGKDLGEAYTGSISAPIIEEFTKGAVLFYVYYRRRHELNGLLDGVVYASLVGLGFAMTENVSYYANALQAGVGALGVNFVVRGILTPFLHPLFTSMTGIGLVLALRARNRRTKIVAPIVGLGLAMLLHSLWNTAAGLGGILIVVWAVVFAPIVVLGAILVRRSIKHEARVIREYLPPGAAPPEDIERLSSFRARIADQVKAVKQGGLKGFVAREEYIGALSDLAFSRYQAAHAGDAAQPEPADPEGFREVLASLRREWRRPTTRVS
jgi:RsiW-degrading membrane proteinase PrsW (M82 family)/ribosomal protein L40E